jgi:hypothetical protein
MAYNIPASGKKPRAGRPPSRLVRVLVTWIKDVPNCVVIVSYVFQFVVYLAIAISLRL